MDDTTLEQQSDTAVTGDNTAITDKEWLDLAWKYFLQHAQQRMQHFNYFIIFSTILVTGFIATFQNNFSFSRLQVAIGILQTCLAVFFAKLDERNSFLVKHAENVIKSYEITCKTPLFLTEDASTLAGKNQRYWGGLPLVTHGQLYRTVYGFFCVLGIAQLILSFIV